MSILELMGLTIELRLFQRCPPTTKKKVVDTAEVRALGSLVRCRSGGVRAEPSGLCSHLS